MQFQHNGFTVSIRFGEKETAQPQVGHTFAIQEDVWPTNINVAFPDGKQLTYSTGLYVNCHGENPAVTVKDIEEWSWGSDYRPEDYHQGIEIYFPDGSLYVFPDGDAIWED